MLSIAPVWAGTSDQLALSLHQRTEKGELVLDILVSNVSTTALEVTSEGIVPPWSVWAWFKWEVDGKEAHYMENVAMIHAMKESWRIPPRGVVLWATIPLRELTTRTKDAYQIAIKDSSRHVVTILPNDRWKELKVTPGKIEVGQ